jgi:hypothetical protein
MRGTSHFNMTGLLATALQFGGYGLTVEWCLPYPTRRVPESSRYEARLFL